MRKKRNFNSAFPLMAHSDNFVYQDLDLKENS